MGDSLDLATKRSIVKTPGGFKSVAVFLGDDAVEAFKGLSFTEAPGRRVAGLAPRATRSTQFT